MVENPIYEQLQVLVKKEVKNQRRILRAIKLDQIDNILKLNIDSQPWNPERPHERKAAQKQTEIQRYLAFDEETSVT